MHVTDPANTPATQTLPALEGAALWRHLVRSTAANVILLPVLWLGLHAIMVMPAPRATRFGVTGAFLSVMLLAGLWVGVRIGRWTRGEPFSLAGSRPTARAILAGVITVAAGTLAAYALGRLAALPAGPGRGVGIALWIVAVVATAAAATAWLVRARHRAWPGPRAPSHTDA